MNANPGVHGVFSSQAEVQPSPQDQAGLESELESESEYEDDEDDDLDDPEESSTRPQSRVFEVAAFIQSSMAPVSHRHSISTEFRKHLKLDSPIGEAQLVWQWAWAQLGVICSVLFLWPRSYDKTLFFLSLAWFMRCATRILSAKLFFKCHKTSDRTSGGRLVQNQLKNRREWMDSIATFIAIVWFVWAHCALYETSPPWRLSSPRLWWLVLSILCINYLMMLECNLHKRAWRRLVLVFIAGCGVSFVVICLLFKPLIPSLLRYFLRGVPHPQTDSEGARLTRPLVDRIPLVVYIPPPPNEIQDGIDGSSMFNLVLQHAPSFAREPIKRLQLTFDFVLSYWYRRDAAIKPSYPRSNSVWEAQWEHCNYPFVRLPPNRAVCAICLVDFKPPKTKAELRTASVPSTPQGQDHHRRHLSNAPVPGPHLPTSQDQRGDDRAQVDENRDGGVHRGDDSEPELEDTDSIAEDDASPRPLRLLSCGHAFHKTCVDAWLLRGNLHGSRQCPVCKRFIEVPPTTGQ